MYLYEEVCKAGKQVFICILGHAILRILQHLAPEGLAEVQGLQH